MVLNCSNCYFNLSSIFLEKRSSCVWSNNKVLNFEKFVQKFVIEEIELSNEYVPQTVLNLSLGSSYSFGKMR